MENKSEQNSSQILEQVFKSEIEKAFKIIYEHVNNAKNELNKAIKVSEEFGIPFESSISFIDNTFTPKSFKEKYSELKLSTEDLNELLDCSLDDYNHFCNGWKYSAVC